MRGQSLKEQEGPKPTQEVRVRTWSHEHKTQACPLRALSKFSPSLGIISHWRVRSGWWTTAATTAPTAAFHVGLGVAKTKICKHVVMFLPLGGGLLESSIDSFSCCMNSPPYTLRSCQMFSNLSKGFLQPSSASLPRKDEKIYIYKLKFLFLIRTDLFKKTTTTTAKMIYILKTRMRYILYYLESQILTETAFLPWWVGKRHPITQGIFFSLRNVGE